MFREEIPYEKMEKKYCRSYWEIGFGLQKIDGQVPSEYLVSLADEQVKNGLPYEEIEEKLTDYYQAQPEVGNAETDFSSLRIAELLSDDGFSLSPATLLGIHKKLFLRLSISDSLVLRLITRQSKITLDFLEMPLL